MLARFAGLLVRVLIETSILCLIMAGLFWMLAYRVTRRLLVTKPDRLEKASANVAPLLQLWQQYQAENSAAPAAEEYDTPE